MFIVMSVVFTCKLCYLGLLQGPWSCPSQYFLVINNFSFFVKSWSSCWCCFLSKHTKHPGLNVEVVNLFPFRGRGLGHSVTTVWTWIDFRFICVVSFIVVLRDFARNWRLPIAQKSVYASCLWRFLQNYCTKLDGHCRVLLAPSAPWLQC